MFAFMALFKLFYWHFTEKADINNEPSPFQGRQPTSQERIQTMAS
jgi:hypothetical protein